MRYIRQEILKEVGKKGQQKLREGTIAIVGLGALGSVSAELLARAGIRKLVLVDRDIVELSNLQRQSLFSENDIGKAKALQAKERLKGINSDVAVGSFIDDLNSDNIGKILNEKYKADLILDCTDNLETRFLLNDFSLKNNIPLIYSAAVGSKGFVFNSIPKRTACLRCFLKESPQLDTCETAGVLNTTTNLISSLQANEAIKILLNRDYEKKLMYFDVWQNKLLKVNVNKSKSCIACAKNKFEYLDGKKSPRIVKLCGEGVYQIKAKSPMGKGQFSSLKNKLEKIGMVADFGNCTNFNGKITIFKDGRALIKAKNSKEAKSVYSKFVGN